MIVNVFDRTVFEAAKDFRITIFHNYDVTPQPLLSNVATIMIVVIVILTVIAVSVYLYRQRLRNKKSKKE